MCYRQLCTVITCCAIFIHIKTIASAEDSLREIFYNMVFIRSATNAFYEIWENVLTTIFKSILKISIYIDFISLIRKSCAMTTSVFLNDTTKAAKIKANTRPLTRKALIINIFLFTFFTEEKRESIARAGLNKKKSPLENLTGWF